VVEIAPDQNGDLEVREAVLVQEGTRDIVLQKRPLVIPTVTSPHKAANALLARHPLAMVLPRFQEITEFNASEAVRMEHPTGKPRIHTNDWTYVLSIDSETGHIADVSQYDRRTNLLLKRVIFEGWHEAPSGRVIPLNVYVRTFEGDDSKPVVEVRFVKIEEEEVPILGKE
jgi:hypothetical protein